MFSCEYWEISKKIYFEEHLRTAASEVALVSDCLGLSFWTVALKTTWFSYIRKNQSPSNQSFKHNSAHIWRLQI